jgi:monoamine oxidase
MKKATSDILIIGAGLTGLTLAYYLKTLNVSVKIIEARDRIGGRIYTKYTVEQAPIELGATWLVEQQKAALELLKALNIAVFSQHYGTTAIYQPNANQAAQLVQLPPNNSTSYRIVNGTQQLIEVLAGKLSEDSIQLNQTIKTISPTDNGLIATSDDYEYHATHIVSTLPPLLFLKSIDTKPALPEALQSVILKTHTWMKDSVRVGFTYKQAFWRNSKTSGTIYCNNGPLQEFYDHSNADNTLHALGGFMNTSFNNYSKDERKAIALKQLQSYYGDQVLTFETYEDCAWSAEKFTTAESDSFLMPQQNNGHPLYQDPYLDNRLFIAGTETSPVFPGKMEGAINSARFVFEFLKPFYSNLQF